MGRWSSRRATKPLTGEDGRQATPPPRNGAPQDRGARLEGGHAAGHAGEAECTGVVCQRGYAGAFDADPGIVEVLARHRRQIGQNANLDIGIGNLGNRLAGILDQLFRAC